MLSVISCMNQVKETVKDQSEKQVVCNPSTLDKKENREREEKNE